MIRTALDEGGSSHRPSVVMTIRLKNENNRAAKGLRVDNRATGGLGPDQA
jgi:hypothetical protein